MKVIVTKSGLTKMEEDLHNMKGYEMKRVMTAIAEAREKGDISESAEYEMAREELNMLTLKIEKLQGKINDAVVVTKLTSEDGSIQIFSKVKLMNHKIKKEINYEIVSEDEIDIRAGKISFNSPIAQALIGKFKGDNVSVEVPAGKLELTVLGVE
jgi:transcription elongation factor GreA